MILPLTKKEQENYKIGLDKIVQRNEEELIVYLNKVFGLITFPTEKKSFKNWSKEQIFFHLLRPEKLLYFFYNKALNKNEPQILLNSFYSFNWINSSFELSNSYDHCKKLKPVLFCYAGNNYDLVDYYLPNNIGKSSNGNRFLISAINLILSIRGQLNKSETRVETEKYLNQKNSQFEISIIRTLLGILNEEPKEISKQLNEVTKLHKSSKWLHDFGNPIGKYLPFFSYGLFSIIYKHHGLNFLKKIEIQDSNIWWKKYQELNLNSLFKAGQDVKIFEGDLSCINRIKTTPNKTSYEKP